MTSPSVVSEVHHQHEGDWCLVHVGPHRLGTDGFLMFLLMLRT
jgi:hypothetical protein